MEEVQFGILKIPKCLMVEEVEVTKDEESLYDTGEAEGEIQENGGVLTKEELIKNEGIMRGSGGGYKRNRPSLYEQNEREYPEGSEKWRRIMGAKKCRRYHERRKGKIVELEEENQVLRGLLSQMRGKLVEAVKTCKSCENMVGLEILEEDVPRAKSWEEGKMGGGSLKANNVTTVKKEVDLETVKMEVDLEKVKNEPEEAPSPGVSKTASKKPRGRSSKKKLNLEKNLDQRPKLGGLFIETLAKIGFELNNQTGSGVGNASAILPPLMLTPSRVLFERLLQAPDNYRIVGTSDGEQVMRMRESEDLPPNPLFNDQPPPPPLNGFMKITDLASATVELATGVVKKEVGEEGSVKPEPDTGTGKMDQ